MRAPAKLQTVMWLSAAIGLFLVTTTSAFAQDSATGSFSGKPVPRFESLRYSEVNGRQGPSLQHKIIWRYKQAGLPVLVTRETEGWRRIRDSKGDEVWMSARMLEEDRTLIVLNETELRQKPSGDSKPIGLLKPGLVVGKQGCTTAWCEVTLSGRRGFVSAAEVWGKESDAGAKDQSRVAAASGTR